MNKKYSKPMLTICNVMALENLSAIFDNFDSFGEFVGNLTTYQFTSGFKGDAVNEEV